MSEHPSLRLIIIIALIGITATIAYYMLHIPDRRSSEEKVSDAIQALDHGFEKAARQLEDRTTAEKLEDAYKEMGDDTK
jgi:uncharacterized membrane protein (DUF106 family)